MLEDTSNRVGSTQTSPDPGRRQAMPSRAASERESLKKARQGMVVLWAIIGAAWVAFCVQAMVRWAGSDEFAPAPFASDERMPTWSFWFMRSVEVASLLWAAGMIWVFLIRPIVRQRELTFEGKIVIGALLTIVIDPMINYFEYAFAWNAQALNLGTWHFTFPLSSDHIGSYGEGLAWAGPMYLYMGFGFSIIMTRIIARMRLNNPMVSNLKTYTTAVMAIWILDTLLELALVRAHVYAFPRTIEAFTLFPGSEFQFPLYESFFVALFALGFCCLRMSAMESPDGLSFVERGIDRVRPALRGIVSTLAIAGFCFVCAFLSYFATWSWLSVNVDSINPHVPSYMEPVRK